MRAPASIALLAAASVIGLSACAPTYDGETVVDAATRPERQCFDADRIVNFRSDQGHVLYVRAANRDVYALSTSGACMDLDNALGIAITPVAGGFNRLCTGDTADITIRNATTPGAPCRARVTSRLTDEQVAALPSRARP